MRLVSAAMRRRLQTIAYPALPPLSAGPACERSSHFRKGVCKIRSDCCQAPLPIWLCAPLRCLVYWATGKAYHTLLMRLTPKSHDFSCARSSAISGPGFHQFATLVEWVAALIRDLHLI